MKELQPKKKQEDHKPWKHSNNDGYEFEKIKPLPGIALSNKEIVCINSYLIIFSIECIFCQGLMLLKFQTVKPKPLSTPRSMLKTSTTTTRTC